jgi:hypothetical protein
MYVNKQNCKYKSNCPKAALPAGMHTYTQDMYIHTSIHRVPTRRTTGGDDNGTLEKDGVTRIAEVLRAAGSLSKEGHCILPQDFGVRYVYLCLCVCV